MKGMLEESPLRAPKPVFLGSQEHSRTRTFAALSKSEHDHDIVISTDALAFPRFVSGLSCRVWAISAV
jgi:hypothetical protein